MAENEFNPLDFSTVARPHGRSDDVRAKNHDEQEIAGTRLGFSPARETAADRTPTPGDDPYRQFAEIRADLERRIRARPLAAVGLSALIGYVLGATR